MNSSTNKTVTNLNLTGKINSASLFDGRAKESNQTLSKHHILVLMLALTLFLSILHLPLRAADMPFIEGYFYPRTIIVAFSAESIGNRSGSIDFTTNRDGVVSTPIESFNSIASEYHFTELKQLHTDVIQPDWNDKGVYLQNIYRILLAENDNIETALIALSKDRNIIWAEYETINRLMYIPNDPRFSDQWHHKTIETHLAWDYVKGSREVIVAITDTGAKWNHPDLADNIWINEAELPGITINWTTGEILGGDGMDNDSNGKIDDVIGWDFFHNTNNPYQNFPGNHHGTHVAGCVGAVGDNNIGVAGVAMNVSLMTCKGASSYQDSEGIRHGYDMIYYAAQSGAHIINCSWGGPGNGNYANNVINYATNLGSLVVAAAGNDDSEHTATYTSFPANADNAMNVAATNSNDTKANFSDYGYPIDVSAPGVNILSTWGNNGYNSINGTSMAAPLVSGIAALLKTLHPGMTPAQLRQRIKTTADYIDDSNQDYIGKLGTGRVNAFTAAMYDKIPKITINDHFIQEHSGDNDGVPNPGDTVNIFISMYNQLYWKLATDVTLTLSTELPGVEILIDEITIPNIDGGSVSFNTNNPLRFRTLPTLSEYVIPFSLTVRANSNDIYPYEVVLNFETELSLQKAGWPLSLTGSTTSPALIKDINGDHSAEIIFGDAQGNLHVVRGNKTALPGFPVNLGSNINSAVAIADLGGDNRINIVANSQGGLINCVDFEGNVLFQYNTASQLRSNPMLVDVNNNGKYEIVTLSFTSPKLFILNHDGTDYPGFPVNIDSGVISAPASADLNRDGNKEIIFVTSGGILHAISTSTGTDIAGFPKALGATSWSGPTVGDISGNGQPDIAVATIQGTVYVFSGSGSQLFSRSVGSPIRTSVIVFDLNLDGNSEIIFGDMSGRLFVLNSSGSDIAPFPKNVGAAIESSPVIADMTRDRNYDIIFGDSNGLLHSISLLGNHTPNFPINLRRSISVSPTIGYVGEVDFPDILVPNQNGYQFVDFKRRIGTIGWSTFQGNIRRTGNNFDMVSIDKVVPEPQLATNLHGNYPNPFNPETTIRFSVGKMDDRGFSSDNSRVTLSVYNIRGQIIDTLVDDKMEPGEYSVSWNGKNSRGEDVGSGVYFSALRVTTVTGSETYTNKMMLIK